MEEDVHYRKREALRIWGLQEIKFVAESRLACLWKVMDKEFHYALKIYKGSNMGSEQQAVQFLKCLDPNFAVQVPRVSLELRAILMEWVPGETLTEVSHLKPEFTVEAVAKLAEVVRRTHFGDTTKYKRVDIRLSNLESARPAPNCLAHFSRDFLRAQQLSWHLRRYPEDLRPIHGDLRYDNVIISPKGPLLIDPKAQIGETGFEIAHVLWLGIENSKGSSIILDRAERYAERVGTAPNRLLQWAAVKLALYISFQSRGTITTDSRSPLLSCLLDLAEA